MKQWYSAEELAGLPGMPDTAEGVRQAAEMMQWTRRLVTTHRKLKRAAPAPAPRRTS